MKSLYNKNYYKKIIKNFMIFLFIIFGISCETSKIPTQSSNYITASMLEHFPNDYAVGKWKYIWKPDYIGRSSVDIEFTIEENGDFFLTNSCGVIHQFSIIHPLRSHSGYIYRSKVLKEDVELSSFRSYVAIMKSQMRNYLDRTSFYSTFIEVEIALEEDSNSLIPFAIKVK